MRSQQTLLGVREVPAVLRPFGCVLAVVFSILCAAPQPARAAPAATATALAVTSAGNAVTMVTSGALVTLTATVTAGSTAVAPGQVNFCDATAKYCTDIHLLGTAELTSAGTATLKLRPGVGSHSYKAVFVGTTASAASASTASALAVTGLYPTISTIAASGNPGDYTLTATVSGNRKCFAQRLGLVSGYKQLQPIAGGAFLDAGGGWVEPYLHRSHRLCG